MLRKSLQIDYSVASNRAYTDLITLRANRDFLGSTPGAPKISYFKYHPEINKLTLSGVLSRI